MPRGQYDRSRAKRKEPQQAQTSQAESATPDLDEILAAYPQRARDNLLKALYDLEMLPPGTKREPFYLALSIAAAELADEAEKNGEAHHAAEMYRRYAKHFEHVSGYTDDKKPEQAGAK